MSYVPTPSAAYRQHRKAAQLLDEPGAPRSADGEPPPPAVPLPFAFGARVLMWKQDPSVSEIGTRKAFLPGIVLDGPRDARIVSGDPGIAPVSPNAFGDFITMPDTPQFDAVHTFAVVRQTLTMYQRALSAVGSEMPLPWQWNSSVDTAPIQVYPYGLPNVMNAFYSRSQCCLKFGDFVPSGQAERVFTCRSFDIVSHETGHAVLDGLKPAWLAADNPPQTGGLHESFGDLTAIFLCLSQLDQCEAIVAQTKARLHDKSFLADIAEQFGLALGASTGLRNADNDLTLTDAGTEVHAISQVFTGAIYDILADLFAFERDPALKDDAMVLHGVGAYLRGLVLRALVAAPDTGATFPDVVNQMLRLSLDDGKPVEYRNFIRNRFTLREVVESPVPLTDDHGDQVVLAARRAGSARRGAGPARLLRHHEPGRVLRYRPRARRRIAGAGALVRRARPQRAGGAAPGRVARAGGAAAGCGAPALTSRGKPAPDPCPNRGLTRRGQTPRPAYAYAHCV